MINEIWVAVIFDDFYTRESMFRQTFLGSNKEVVDRVNKYLYDNAVEMGITTIEHGYMDELGEESIYRPIEEGIELEELILEDDETNRVYVKVFCITQEININTYL